MKFTAFAFTYGVVGCVCVAVWVSARARADTIFRSIVAGCSGETISVDFNILKK